MKKYFYIPMIICSLSGLAQNIQQISEADIQGIRILSDYSFVAGKMNDYLSSSSDLFLEYGLQKIFVNEYLVGNDQVTLEVYIMGNAPSAFGIYSLSISHCDQMNLFGSFSCISLYHVAAVHGSFFIYASNKTGTQSGQDLCQQLVKLIIDKNPQEIWYAPALTQSAKAAPFTNTLRYYKGPLGLKRGFPVWSDMFENLSFHMYTMNISTPDYTGILARITFPDERSLDSFIMKSSPSTMGTSEKLVQTSTGFYRSWYKINETKILLMECTSPETDIKDFLPAMPDYKWLAEE
jgi:hypothetical protein